MKRRSVAYAVTCLEEREFCSEITCLSLLGTCPSTLDLPFACAEEDVNLGFSVSSTLPHYR